MDEKDTQILVSRQDMLFLRERPGIGDVVKFADGQRQRIAIRLYDNIFQMCGMNGNFYLGRDGSSFSGAPYGSVDLSGCELTDKLIDVGFWFFKHDQWEAHNGINVTAKVHVWKCNQKSPEKR